MSRRILWERAPKLFRSTCVLVAVVSGGVGCKPSSNSSKRPDLEQMVLVPAGTFLRGTQDGNDDERPMRKVYLSAFYIDRTEVTNAQFKAFCDATQRIYPNNPRWDPEYFLTQPDHPVVNITYAQAEAYCEWAGKHLPTEAQWEKAARGTDGRLYPWGNEWHAEYANLKGDPFHRSAPVGSFPEGASPYGALDMVGNVWEWCLDWYVENYYAKAPRRNPGGPPGPQPWRVVRGGGFSSPQSDAVTANRSKNKPNRTIHHVGCRCAWTP